MRKKRPNFVEEEYKQYGGENGYEFVSNSWFESQRKEGGSFFSKLLQILLASILAVVLLILVKVGYDFWFENSDAKIMARAQKEVNIGEKGLNQASSSMTKDQTQKTNAKIAKAQSIANQEAKQKSAQVAESSKQSQPPSEGLQESKKNNEVKSDKSGIQAKKTQENVETLEGEKLVQYLLSLPPDQLEKIDVKKLLLSKRAQKTQNEYLNNQVVVGKKEAAEKNDELAKLSQELESVIEPEVQEVQKSVPAEEKSYIKGLEKEAVVREKNMRYYVVQPGDTLSKIAAKFYGSGKEYIKIYEANQDIISKPELIYPGQRLRIPAL